jgi:hypothetical protein
VWAVAVVMLDVRLKNMVEMVGVHDEHSVEAFAAYGANPALSVGVGDRRRNRSLDDADCFAGEDRVEGAGEFGVAVTDQETPLVFLFGPAGGCGVCDVGEQVARLLSDQSPVGLLVIPARCTRRLFSSMKNST